MPQPAVVFSRVSSYLDDCMDAGFRILEHPADIGIEAYGKDLAEAFAQAATALMSIILELSSVKARESKHVTLTAADIEHLLVKWLTEVLYLYDGEEFAGCRFEVQDINDTHLHAVIHGEPFAAVKHPTKLDVKAITYHQIKVDKTNEGVNLRVFLDI